MNDNLSRPSRPFDELPGAAGGPVGAEKPNAGTPLIVGQHFDEDSLYALRAAVSAHATQAGMPPPRVYDVVSAVHELAANAVRHGAGHGQLSVWALDGMLYCQISDTGPPLSTSGAASQRTDGAGLGSRAEVAVAEAGVAEAGGTDLSVAGLSGTDFGGTDLGGTDLGGTDLGGTDLGGTDLGGSGSGEGAGAAAADPGWPARQGHGLWLVRLVADATSLGSGPAGTVATVCFDLGSPGPYLTDPLDAE